MAINPNAALVARHLKEKLGLTDAQAAGVLGNFAQESGFNPRVNEGGKVGAPMGQGGYGLAQWTGGRQTNLVNFARQKRMDPGDPYLQAQFLTSELQGPEKSALASLRGAVSPEQSALVFRRDYERAGEPNDANRLQAARTAFNQLGSIGPAPQTSGSPPLPGVAATLSGALGQDIAGKSEAPKSLAQRLVDQVKSGIIQNMFPQGLFGTLMAPSNLGGL
jgi:hypothetical protein